MAASAELAALGPSRSLAKRPREPTVSSDDDEDDLTVSSLLLSNRCQRRPQPRTRQETDKAKPVPGREPPRSGARPNRGSDSEHASAARASSSSQAPGVSEGRPRSLKATTSTLGSTRNGTSKRGGQATPAYSSSPHNASPLPPLQRVARKSAPIWPPSSSADHQPSYPTPLVSPPRTNPPRKTTACEQRPPPLASTSRPELVVLSSDEDDEVTRPPKPAAPKVFERERKLRKKPEAKAVEIPKEIGGPWVDPEDFIATAEYSKIYDISLEWFKMPRMDPPWEVLNIVLTAGLFGLGTSTPVTKQTKPVRLTLEESDELFSYYPSDLSSPLSLTFDPTLESSRAFTHLELRLKVTYGGCAPDPQPIFVTARRGTNVGRLSEGKVDLVHFEEAGGRAQVAAEVRWEMRDGGLGKRAGNPMEELERRIERFELGRDIDVLPDAKKMGKRERRGEQVTIPDFGPSRLCYHFGPRVPYVPGEVFDDLSDEDASASRFILRRQEQTIAAEDPPIEPKHALLIRLSQKWDALNAYAARPANRIEAMLVHYAPQVVQYDLLKTVAWFLRGHHDHNHISQRQRDKIWKSLEAEIERLSVGARAAAR